MAVQEISANNCFSVTWAIKNYSYCWQKKDEAIVSPVFSIYLPEETKWNLLLFPRGTLDGNRVTYFLHRMKDCKGADKIEIEYYLEVINADGTALKYTEIKHTFCKDSQWGYRRFIYRKDLVENRMKFLPQDILTVRCRIKCLEEKSMKIRQIFAETIVNIKEISLLWTIQEFSSLTPNQKKLLIIKSASEEALIKIELFLTDKQYLEEKINLNIYPADKCMKFFTLQHSLLNAKGVHVATGEFENFCKHGEFSTFPLTLSRNQLMKGNKLYLPNDVLSLRLEFAISTGFAYEGVTKIDLGTIALETAKEVREDFRIFKSIENVTENSSTLIDDLMSLYKDQSFCDMKLQTKTNSFPVHTAILGARSPVFKAMFSTDMKEKLNGRVDMSHLDDRTVNQLLLYLYTNKLEDLKCEEALRLYAEADKYAIISLKDQCSLLLRCNLNQENACRILILSDLHQDEDLKIIAQDFILKKANEIFKSVEWMLLEGTHSKLALEIFRRNWNEG